MFVKPVKSLLNDERGATAIEYGILAALMAVAVIGAVSILGPQLTELYEGIIPALNSPGPAPTPGTDG